MGVVVVDRDDITEDTEIVFPVHGCRGLSIHADVVQDCNGFDIKVGFAHAHPSGVTFSARKIYDADDAKGLQATGVSGDFQLTIDAPREAWGIVSISNLSNDGDTPTVGVSVYVENADG